MLRRHSCAWFAARRTLARALLRGISSTTYCAPTLWLSSRQTVASQLTASPLASSLTRLSEPQLLPATMCTAAPDQCVFVGDPSPDGHPALYLAAVAKLAAIHRASYHAGAVLLQIVCPCVTALARQSDISIFDGRLRRQFALCSRHSCGTRLTSAQDAGGAPIPLVVNNAGWVKGPGLSVLVDLLAAVGPSHVVCINSGLARKDLPRGTFWDDTVLSSVQRMDLQSLQARHSHNVPDGVLDAASPWPTLCAASAATAAPPVPARPAAEARAARLHAWPAACTPHSQAYM